MNSAEHIAKIQVYMKNIDRELHTMRAEKHLTSPATWVYQGDLEADLRGLAQSLKEERSMKGTIDEPK